MADTGYEEFAGRLINIADCTAVGLGSRQNILRMIARGDIKASKIGKSVRIHGDSVIALINKSVITPLNASAER
ncbi:helix-turn-helix domain-containing protein [Ruegeria arenilitoris]|uniref:helix-turn-helix domain-containing protein n=1 Tax=Ruegeria arenilitoris TaxID=1173585 RepID=UPI001480E703|nr:helix-turn-helix domain-containing protein [Ruegeria arenilitoris]